MSKFLKTLIVCFLISMTVIVDANIKCDEGKPGDIVNCSITSQEGYNGTISRIKVDNGLNFISCDVCKESGDYSINANSSANFKFQIAKDIVESKSLNVSFAGETSSIKVIVENQEESNDTTYTVTLIPGNDRANITKTCTVNSLNTTCNVTLDDIEDENFTGWGKEKTCTEGSKGNIKVNKDITYYACFKNISDNEEKNADILLKSLVVKNGDEVIDLGFSIRITEYEVIVPTEVTSLDIEAVAQDDNVEIEIVGNDKLEQENNEIKIVLTKEDGSTNEYIINVNKSDEEMIPVLNNLIIAGYLNDFQSDKFVYTISIDKGINELTIDYTKNNEEDTVEIKGNNNLKNGSKINIIVTDLKTEKNSVYTINIEQESSNLLIYIVIGSGLLLLLIILLIIVVKKGKKNSKTPPKKSSIKPVVNTVNSKPNIPEIKPTIPTPPSVVNNNQNEDLEVLDF